MGKEKEITNGYIYMEKGFMMLNYKYCLMKLYYSVKLVFAEQCEHLEETAGDLLCVLLLPRPVVLQR